MTRSRTPTAPPLRLFALRIGGPIDFLISGSINALIAWGVFLSDERVALVGWHSVLVVSGPMFFILPLITTITGFLSGVAQRRTGRYPPVWVDGTVWSDRAWRVALLRSVIVGAVGCSAIILADDVLVAPTLQKWTYVAGNGLLSGTLGYCLHATAILRAGRI